MSLTTFDRARQFRRLGPQRHAALKARALWMVLLIALSARGTGECGQPGAASLAIARDAVLATKPAPGMTPHLVASLALHARLCTACEPTCHRMHGKGCDSTQSTCMTQFEWACNTRAQPGLTGSSRAKQHVHNADTDP